MNDRRIPRMLVAACAAAAVAAAVSASSALGVPTGGADEIGARTASGMKIETELEEPEAMQTLMGGSWMIQQPEGGATHHFEAVLEDPTFGGRIPYASVTAAFVNLATKRAFARRLEPMYGKNFHYGANVALAKGDYRVTVTVQPPRLMRVGEAVNRWLKPVKTDFRFRVS